MARILAQHGRVMAKKRPLTRDVLAQILMAQLPQQTWEEFRQLFQQAGRPLTRRKRRKRKRVK